MKTLCNWHIIFFLIGSLALNKNLYAQAPTPLPILTPSYSEDFTSYSTYPSICFTQTFKDDLDRLWLLTCSSASATNALHLFQFDGYQFRLIQGALKALTKDDWFYGKLGSSQLVGVRKADDNNQLFLYDLLSNQLTFYPLQLPGKVVDITVSAKGQILLTVIKGEEVIVAEWKDGNLKSQVVFKEPIFAQIAEGNILVETMYHDEDLFWGSIRDAGYFVFVEKNSTKVQKFYFNDLLQQKGDQLNTRSILTNVHSAKVIKQSNQFYINTRFFDGCNMYRWNVRDRQFVPLEGIPERWIGENIFKDEQGNIIFLFKDQNRQFKAILLDTHGQRYNYDAFFKDLHSSEIHELYSPDFKKRILICDNKGISVHFVKDSEAIRHFLPSYQVRAMAELNDGQFLISTYDNQFVVDPNTNITHQLHNPDCFLGWTKFHTDTKGRIWTHSNSDLLRYDPYADTCKIYPCESENIRLFTFADTNTIFFIDRAERLYQYDIANQKTVPFLTNGHQLTFPGYAHEILRGKNDLLWVATAKGLWKIDLNTHQVTVLGGQPPFKEDRFLSMSQDEEGRLWLGTPLDGLYIFDPRRGTAINISSKDGLPNNTIASIIADDEGVRWLGTYNGISLVSKEGNLLTNIYPEDGLVEAENNRYATLKTTNGKLLIGTVNGVNYIDPLKIKEKINKHQDVKIYLTSLRYFDAHAGKDTIQEYALDDIGTIHLPAAKRFLNVNFALSNYFKSHENQYAYLLEGIDENWISLGNQHQLNLNSLPAGDYRLLIKGSDGWGNWTKEPLSIQIHAKEFFYKQPWFYMMCFVVLGGIGLLWITRLRQAVKAATKRINADKAIIQKQAKELKELDQAKTKFFTNISHEFRTPLTIISGMIDQVRSKPDIWLDKGANLIKQNSLHLLNLINQILELRKLESKNLSLNLVQGDMVQYLRYLTESYQNYAENQNMRLHFLSAQPSIIMDYDPDKILKIVSNLLSNAIKFNKESGDIYFQIDEKQEGSQSFVLLRVKDTGWGIPQHKVPYIFDRFYQVNAPGEKKVIGSGIGLSLTKELVQLMNGSIEVNSEVEVGTTFLIKLPITRKAMVKVSTTDIEAIPQKVFLANPTTTTAPLAEDIHINVNDDALPQVLIVEDNPEIIQILVACLEDSYNLEIATNGAEGIEKAIEQVPDIIISDVMMPIKDGFELTDTLKQDERTSHIPIILLTAKADLDSKISGLEKGADDYLAKPFEAKELLARLKNLLNIRQQLQKRYADNAANFSAEAASPEDIFIKKLQHIISENSSDEDFGIPQLCKAIALSRTQLHNKIKALTGKSTSIYIRSYRLQKAKKLLQDTDLTVSEIAYEVGFRDPNYFSRTFIDEFGEPPSRTRK